MKKLLLFLTKLLTLTVLSLTVYDAQAQTIRLSGKVTSGKNHEPLLGASVTVKDSTVGTITDYEGAYLLDVEMGKTIIFSYLGMNDKMVQVTESTPRMLNVNLDDGGLLMDDIVVVGYGIQKKESVVGAISQVKSDDLSKTGGVTNISNALTGLVPGLTTLSYSGKPGSDDSEIIIRAKSTWNGASPLILVDGIERNMNDIDINEVESISVLKDASATAVFGVRGGNGVILVTTKRGVESEPIMTATVNITLKSKSKMPTNLGSYDALWLRNQAIENQLAVAPDTWSYITPVAVLQQYRDQTDPETYPDVDWQNEMVNKYSWSQRYAWDVKGGTKFVKYYGSLSYTYDGDILKGQDFGQGYIPKNDYERYNYRINVDMQPTSTTTFGISLDGSQGTEQSTNATPAYLWLGVYSKGPDQYPVRYSDGTFANNENGYNMYNPVVLYNYSGMTRETRMDINNTFSLDQKLDFLTKGLSLKGIVSFRNYYYSIGNNLSASLPMTKYVDWRTGQTTWNYPSNYLSQGHGFDYVLDENTVSTEKAVASGNGGRNVYKSLMYQASLNYNRKIDKHRLGGLLLFKRIETAQSSAFPTYREEWAARATYDFDNRYLLEFNGAYNGSEKFATGKKFGFFPSAAIGWVVSQERFIRETSISDYVDLLKIRYSWGKVGSDNNIAKWLYITQWSQITNSAKFGYPDATTSPYTGYKVSKIGNKDARWETAVKNDLAIDMSLFGNTLTLTYDYFWGNRYDIFMNASQRNVPPWFGAEPVSANIGRTHEWGWEFETRYTNKTSWGLTYYVGAMCSFAKDVIDYMEDPELTPDYQKKAGYQIGQQTGTLSSGVITSWDEMYTGVTGDKYSQAVVGMLQLIDYNGDGVVDTNDVVPYGYPNLPQYTMNFTAGFDWNGFSFMIQLYGTRNCTLAQSAGEFSSPAYYSVVDSSVADDMWLPRYNTSGTYRTPTYMLSGNAESTGTYHLVDGTLWRLKNAEIAYTMRNKSLEKLGIGSCRFFVNGNNIFLYSHLNEDRETGGKRENTNVSKYPLTKRFNFGLKLEF